MEKQKIGQILTLVFYTLAVAALASYFFIPDRVWFFTLGFSAIGVRVVTYFLRQIL